VQRVLRLGAVASGGACLLIDQGIEIMRKIFLAAAVTGSAFGLAACMEPAGEADDAMVADAESNADAMAEADSADEGAVDGETAEETAEETAAEVTE